MRRVGAHPAQVPGGATRLHGAGVRPVAGVGRPRDGQLRAGHFWTRDLRKARADLLSEGHCPKVAMRSLCEWRALRLRAGDADCVINELAEEAADLQAWMQRLGLKYRGQRLASAASEAFMQLLKAQRELPQNREQILAAQGGLCKLCGAPVGLGTCEFDHVVPVHQAFRGQIQELQALCLECHRTKTALENSHATTLESRFMQPPGLRGLRPFPEAAAAGVRPAEVGPRQAVPRHRRGAVPQERAGQRPLPSSRFLSPGHHCGGEAGPSGGSLVIEEVTQLDAGLWADIACVSMDRSVRFLLMGDFKQLPAVLDSFAGSRVERALKDSDLLHDLASGYCHELLENQRSDERIFRFIGWLRVGEAEEVPLAEAVRVARREFPRPQTEHPDVCLVISHAHRVQINERENRRLAPQKAVLIEHKEAGAPTTNSPQSMRVWPGLKLVGAGGKVAKGTFVQGGVGRGAGLLARGAAAADEALPRHHLRLVPGAHLEGPRLAPGLRNAAFQPAAPLRGS